ncbi:MAG: ATP synthase subunit I [Gammaproteobacteria bacterium]|nr:ATP synthase subunit I [Gammaproteobacteria bacterium]MBL6819357.1 ATP synthase subunit I [Gammaproteobacteria bacterium]MBL6898536.1 ATP synthase subunit I [Gammaproteobacteria bacterium]
MRRVIAFQGIIAVVIALVFMNMGYQKIESSLFGGVISIVNTLLLARSVNQAGNVAVGQNISGGTLVLFKSLLIRIALVLIGFYVGIVTLSLDALQMLVAFAVTQIGYVFNKNKTIY